MGRYLVFVVLDPEGHEVAGVEYPNIIEARAHAGRLGVGYGFDSRWRRVDGQPV